MPYCFDKRSIKPHLLAHCLDLVDRGIGRHGHRRRIDGQDTQDAEEKRGNDQQDWYCSEGALYQQFGDSHKHAHALSYEARKGSGIRVRTLCLSAMLRKLTTTTWYCPGSRHCHI